MFRSERAKQFLAFDALKGLREELEKREEKFLNEDKKELTEEEISSLSLALTKVNKGDQVEIVFYCRKRYVLFCGAVNQVNLAYKFLVVGQMKIFFDDVKSLTIKE